MSESSRRDNSKQVPGGTQSASVEHSAIMLNLSPSLSNLAIPDADDVLFTLGPLSAKPLVFAPPTVTIDGITIPLRLGQAVETVRGDDVLEGVQEIHIRRSVLNGPHLTLELILRVAAASPIVRFRWVLHSSLPVRLTKPKGGDALTFFTVTLPDFLVGKEQRISEFHPLFHSFMPTELPIPTPPSDAPLFGPILVGYGADYTALVAYEHGSQVPDAFLSYVFTPTPAADERIDLRAVKGSYVDGQVVGPDAPYESLWFQAAAADVSPEQLSRHYREWVLRFQTPNRASREPYIFYNTWAYQERVKHWQKRPYLADMNEARMLAEIEVAHRMGIDVFVIDTGWYEKTGDWRVSSARFPNGLAPIKERLDKYGMKLGLWFNPTVAAVSSEMRRNHEDCLMTVDGKPHDPHEVWETEASQGLCLVSRYGEAFADELIRLNREVGVTYFKWDAIGQYGCDAPGHFHGGEESAPEERRNRYAFLLGTYMTKVVDRLCAACPDAIVDFDITEGGRTVGLQFLSAGKYFLINNGPYNHDYNMPVPADGNVNLFFFPGPARTWICRAPLTYDAWIPSILFLTHYLPDDTHHEWWAKAGELEGENQWLAIASLVLGQNGIWGDLCSLSDAGIARFTKALGLYKQVRHDITTAYPVTAGAVAGSPEVHEKINGASGRGVVSVFAAAPGTYIYQTENPTAPTLWHNDGVSVRRLSDGRAQITATFRRGQYAKVVFFGIDESAT